MHTMENLQAQTFLQDPEAAVRALTVIDMADLEQELEVQASYMGFAVVQYEKSRAAEDAAKAFLKVAEAEEVRRIEAGMSQWKVDHAVRLCPAVQEAEAAYTYARYRTGLFKGLISALEHKKDMIVQLAARRRVEAASHPG